MAACSLAMCELQTRPQTDVNPPRVELPSAGAYRLAARGDNFCQITLPLVTVMPLGVYKSLGPITENGNEKCWTAVDFYRAMLCIRGTSHGPVSVRLSVRLSVCPSQVGVLLKRLNVGSHKQHHTIPHGV